MPSKSRDRHLAKNAERRRQERTRAKRSKQAALGVGGVIAAVLLILLGIGILTRNSDQQQAAATPSVSTPGGASGPRRPAPSRPRRTRPPRLPAAPRCPPRPPSRSRSSTAPPRRMRSSRRTRPTRRSCRPRAAPSRSSSTTRPRRSRWRTSSSWPSRGIYDGQSVSRVVDSIDVVQAGAPTGTTSGGPGLHDPRRAHRQGALRTRHDRDGQRRPQHGRIAVLPDHGARGRQPRCRSQLHDLRAGHRGAATSPSRSTP